MNGQTHKEGAALQTNHNVSEFWDWCGSEAHIRHVLLHLHVQMSNISSLLSHEDNLTTEHLVLVSRGLAYRMNFLHNASKSTQRAPHPVDIFPQQLRPHHLCQHFV